MGLLQDFKSFDTIFSPKARWVMVVLSLAISVLSLTLSQRNTNDFANKAQKVCYQISHVTDSINTGRAHNRTLYRKLISDALTRINTPAEQGEDKANVQIYTNYLNSIPSNLVVNCSVLK